MWPPWCHTRLTFDLACLFQLLARHSELEQSETKAQGALVTILSLTQITELKLLLDIGRQGHRFYDFVLTLLIACISLEIFVGMIIIYIGNLHYYQATERTGWCYDIANCFLCCCRACRWSSRKNGTYLSVRATTASREPLQRTAVASHEDEEPAGCCDWPLEPRMESIIDLERADSNIEVARVKVADADVKIVRSSNYVKVVEEALKRTPANPDLEEELNKARDECSGAMREKEEAEAEQKLAEAQQHHAFFVKEQYEDRQERITFRKISFWQHMATYLLYFVMLMNVFITTFGISGGLSGMVINIPHRNGTHNSGNVWFSRLATMIWATVTMVVLGIWHIYYCTTSVLTYSGHTLYSHLHIL